MAIGSLLLFLALLVLVALIVARPLLDVTEEDSFLDSESSQWLAERERVLDALAELDADWSMGKIPKDIYAEQRGLLLAKGAIALEKLEKAEKPVTGRSTHKKTKKKTSDELEALIAAYKAKDARRK
jgi:hypothetical protein